MSLEFEQELQDKYKNCRDDLPLSGSTGTDDEETPVGEEAGTTGASSFPQPPLMQPPPAPEPRADRMQVYLRVRPVTPAELAKCQACSGSNGSTSCFQVDSDTVVVARPPVDTTAAAATDRFTFSRVFAESVDQRQLYAGTVAAIVDQLVSGGLTSGLVFTYGVTGSGKTYTVQGTPESPGVLPQALVALFAGLAGRLSPPLFRPVSFAEVQPVTGPEAAAGVREVESLLGPAPAAGDGEALATDEAWRHSATPAEPSSSSNYRYSVWISFAEIYNEVVYDLLEPVSCGGGGAAGVGGGSRRPLARAQLGLRTDRSGCVYIRGLRCLPVASARQAYQLMLLGKQNQQVAATNLNQQSSRSHTLFAIRLVRWLDAPVPQYGQVSNLTFCDLAGSERQRGSGSLGDRTREAGSINASLLTLHRCVAALQYNHSRQSHRLRRRRSTTASASKAAAPKPVPFRDSKLTRFIQPYFSGSGRAVMIVNIGQCPALYDETLNALRFSALARCVVVSEPAPKRIRLTAAPVAAAAAAAVEADDDDDNDDDGDLHQPFDTDGLDDEADVAEIAKYDKKALLSLVFNLRRARRQAAEDSEARELQIRCELTAERDRLLSRVEERFEQQLQQQRDKMLERHDERMHEYLGTSQKLADHALERCKQRAAARAASLAEQLREAAAERDQLRARVTDLTAELASERLSGESLRRQLAEMRDAARRAMDTDRDMRARRIAEFRRLIDGGNCGVDSLTSQQPAPQQRPSTRSGDSTGECGPASYEKATLDGDNNPATQ